MSQEQQQVDPTTNISLGKQPSSTSIKAKTTTTSTTPVVGAVNHGPPPPSDASLAAVRAAYSANTIPPTMFPLLDTTHTVIIKPSNNNQQRKGQSPVSDAREGRDEVPSPISSPTKKKGNSFNGAHKIDIVGVLPQLSICFEGLSVAAKKANQKSTNVVAKEDSTTKTSTQAVAPPLGAKETTTSEYGATTTSNPNLLRHSSASVLVDENSARMLFNYQQTRRPNNNIMSTSVISNNNQPTTPTRTGGVAPQQNDEGDSDFYTSTTEDLLLNNVTGIMYGGRLTGVVSACGGSSNSVLLGVVSGRMAKFGTGAVPAGGRMDGSVWANNVPFALPKYTLGAVLVDDDSTSFEDLTVKQNLSLSLMLRKKRLRNSSKKTPQSGRNTNGGGADDFTDLDDGGADDEIRLSGTYAPAFFRNLVKDSQDVEFLEHMIDLLELRSHKGVQLKKCSQFVRRKVLVVQEALMRPFLLLLDGVTHNLPTHEAKILLRMLKQLLHDPYLYLDAADITKDRLGGEVGEGIFPMTYSNTNNSSSSSDGGYQRPLSAAVLRSDGELQPVFIPSMVKSATSNYGEGGTMSNSSSGNYNNSSRSPLLGPQQRDLLDAASSIDAAVTTCNKPAIVVGMTQPRWAYLSILDDVVLMEKNRVVFEGTSEELLQAAYEMYFKYTSREVSSMHTIQEAAAVGRAGSRGLMSRENEAMPPTANGGGTAATEIPSPEVVINFLFNVASDPETEYCDSLLVQLAPRGHLPKTAQFINNQIMEFVQGVSMNTNNGEGRSAGGLTGVSFTPFANNSSGNVVGESKATTTNLLGTYRGRVQISEQRLRSIVALKKTSESNVLNRFTSKNKPHPAKRLWFMLTYASWYSLMNEWKFFVCLIVVLLGSGWTLAAVYRGQGGQVGMQNRVGIIFSVITATFLQAVIGAERLRTEINSFRWHRINGYFGPFVYLVYWFTTCALIRFFFVGVFSMLTFGIGNISHSKIDFTQIQELQVFFGLSSVSCAVLSFLVTAATPTTTIAFFLMFMAYALSVLGAGLILSLRSFPEIVQTISRVSIIRLGYESSLVSQFSGQEFGCADRATTVVSSSNDTASYFGKEDQIFASNESTTTTGTPIIPNIPMACYTGNEYLNFLGFNQDHKWTNMTILGTITTILLVLSFIALQVFRRPNTASSISSRRGVLQ